MCIEVCGLRAAKIDELADSNEPAINPGRTVASLWKLGNNMGKRLLFLPSSENRMTFFISYIKYVG